MSSFEMQDLSHKKFDVNDASGEQATPHADESMSFWTVTASAILGGFALLLLLFPRFLAFLAAPDASSLSETASLTALEQFLATHLGIYLLGISFNLLLLTPSWGPLNMNSRTDATHPLLVTTTLCASVSGFVSYNTHSVGPLTNLVSILMGTIGIVGFWEILFLGSSAISRKTGADKHTSRLIFGNKSAASSIKKRWTKERQS